MLRTNKGLGNNYHISQYKNVIEDHSSIDVNSDIVVYWWVICKHFNVMYVNFSCVCVILFCFVLV